MSITIEITNPENSGRIVDVRKNIYGSSTTVSVLPRSVKTIVLVDGVELTVTERPLPGSRRNDESDFEDDAA